MWIRTCFDDDDIHFKSILYHYMYDRLCSVWKGHICLHNNISTYWYCVVFWLFARCSDKTNKVQARTWLIILTATICSTLSNAEIIMLPCDRPINYTIHLRKQLGQITGKIRDILICLPVPNQRCCSTTFPGNESMWPFTFVSRKKAKMTHSVCSLCKHSIHPSTSRYRSWQTGTPYTCTASSTLAPWVPIRHQVECNATVGTSHRPSRPCVHFLASVILHPITLLRSTEQTLLSIPSHYFGHYARRCSSVVGAKFNFVECPASCSHPCKLRCQFKNRS